MYAAQAPTDLMVRQIGIIRVRVSWTPPPNPPRDGYLITTGARPTDFNAGIRVLFGKSSQDVNQALFGTNTYWLVALYGTPIVVGPVSGIVRGEEMTYYAQSVANECSIRFQQANKYHFFFTNCHICDHILDPASIQSPK